MEKMLSLLLIPNKLQNHLMHAFLCKLIPEEIGEKNRLEIIISRKNWINE